MSSGSSFGQMVLPPAPLRPLSRSTTSTPQRSSKHEERVQFAIFIKILFHLLQKHEQQQDLRPGGVPSGASEQVREGAFAVTSGTAEAGASVSLSTPPPASSSITTAAQPASASLLQDAKQTVLTITRRCKTTATTATSSVSMSMEAQIQQGLRGLVGEELWSTAQRRHRQYALLQQRRRRALLQTNNVVQQQQPTALNIGNLQGPPLSLRLPGYEEAAAANRRSASRSSSFSSDDDDMPTQIVEL